MIKIIRNFIKKYKFYFLFFPLIGWLTPVYFLIFEDDLDFWYNFEKNILLRYSSIVVQSFFILLLILYLIYI